jgi:hypothetical protein
MPSCKRAGACLGYTPSWLDSGHESRFSPARGPLSVACERPCAQRSEPPSGSSERVGDRASRRVCLRIVDRPTVGDQRMRPAVDGLPWQRHTAGMPRGKWLLDGRSSRWHRSVRAERWVAGCFISLGLVGTAVAEDAPTPVDSAADDASSSTPSSAPAPVSEETRRLLTQGKARYTAGDYATALDLFQRAYATAQNPAILFNIGATYAAMRQCRSAHDTYHRYIQQTGSESGRADARRLLERLGDCDAEPSSDPVPHEPEAPQSQPAAVPSEVAEDVPAVSPQHRAGGVAGRTPDHSHQRTLDGGPSGARVAGWVALGSGGVMLLGSLGFAYASWQAEDSESGSAPGVTGDDAAREQAQGRRYNSLAWGLAGGSAALMSSGLLILMLDSKPQTSVRVGSPQAGVGFRLSFDHRF